MILAKLIPRKNSILQVFFIPMMPPKVIPTSYENISTRPSANAWQPTAVSSI
jgi:hypothetical protein